MEPSRNRPGIYDGDVNEDHGRTSSSNLLRNREIKSSTLEQQIGVARRHLQPFYTSLKQTKDTVIRSIHTYETNVKSFIHSFANEDETWLPGVGFVTTSALIGSIVARNRGWMIRTLSPITFAGMACYFWYPKLKNRLWNDLKSTQLYQKTSRRVNEKYQDVSELWERK